MLGAIRNLVVLALIGAGVYYLWNWQFAGSGDDEAMSYAEGACRNAIRHRFDSSVRVNSVKRNERGYVVRASTTVARGAVVKVTCLTNTNGTVEEIFVEER